MLNKKTGKAQLTSAHPLSGIESNDAIRSRFRRLASNRWNKSDCYFVVREFVFFEVESRAGNCRLSSMKSRVVRCIAHSSFSLFIRVALDRI